MATRPQEVTRPRCLGPSFLDDKQYNYKAGPLILKKLADLDKFFVKNLAGDKFMDTAQAVKQVKQEGYVLLENLLSEEDCEMYKSMLNRDHAKYASKYADTMAKDNVMQSKEHEKIVYNLHNKDIKYFDLCHHLAVIPIVKDLLQEGSYQNAEPFNLLGFDARCPKQNSKPQQLHRDSSLPGQGAFPIVIVVLFMLDEFTEENGATRVVPGSHLRLDFAENDKTYDNELTIEAGQGSVLLFNGALWHGGGKKSTDASRWAVLPYYGRWILKPSFNFSENIPSGIYEQLTDERKTLLGLNCCPPKDEFTRTTRRSKEFEWQAGYELISSTFELHPANIEVST